MTDFTNETVGPTPSRDDLEATFHAGARPRQDWKIGVEYEKPVVVAATGESAPYEGPNGIGRLLEALLARSTRWEGIYENQFLIGLRDGRASITLEPGGQFEMSGELCDSLHCADRELQEHVREILAAGQEVGVDFLGLGAVPKTPLGQLPWMPKQRYAIMREIMQSTGTLGHRMMQQTATVQANFDYSDERDAAQKMRLSMALVPVLVAVSANSPIVDGGLSGYHSFRAHVWTDTDADRCGILPFCFDTEGIFNAYTEYALDVPMYFVVRSGQLLPTNGLTFRGFLERGHEGQRATLEDWNTHLTTLFPEVRLKTYIEIRSADSQSVELMLGTPALMKGLLYDQDCMVGALDVVKGWTASQVRDLHENAARQGMTARAGRHTMADYARDIVGIAREGLRRQALLDEQGRDESIYLDRLEEDVVAGRCPADRILELWRGDWDGEIDGLLAHTRYSP